MSKRFPVSFRSLQLIIVLVVALMATAVSAQQGTPAIVPVNPTPTPVRPTLEPVPPSTLLDGEEITIPSFEPPPTLDELLVVYPDLAEYLAQIADVAPEELDLADLYSRIVAIYEEQGAGGLAVFLSDSGLLDKLGIPQSYLDFLTTYDEGGIEAVDALARERQLINDQDELLVWMAVDSRANLPELTASLEALGVSVYRYMPNTREVEIGIPLDILAQYQTPGGILGYLVAVANVPHSAGVRPPVRQFVDSPALQTIPSVGADHIGASAWHAAGFTGEGIRVGVIDLGFAGVNDLLGNELPANVNSFQDIDQMSRSPEVHGTAVSVVVHRAAPDAELFIADASGSYDEWIDILNYMLDNEVQIINYSVGSMIGPLDGTWGSTLDVDEFIRLSGALWVNSAGNSGSSHSLFEFNGDADGIHQFGEDVSLMPFMPFTPVTAIGLNWDGNWEGGESDNYGMYLIDSNNNVVAAAEEPRTGGANDLPYQLLEAETIPGEIYYLAFQAAPNNSRNHVLNLFLVNCQIADWAIVPNYSVTAPGDSLSALTVGATGLTNDTLEEYSSQGPTMGDDLKPDVTAPTGERVPGFDDEFGFTGTSGSSPLVAGIAALVLQANPDFTNSELKAFLMANVLDLGEPGADPTFGAGQILLSPPNQELPPPETATGSAKIYSVNAEYGVLVNGEPGMNTTISFSVISMQGRQVAAAVSIREANGNPIPSAASAFEFGGTIGSAVVFDVQSTTENFSGVSIFLPDAAVANLPIGTPLVLNTGIYDVTDPANPVPLLEAEPIQITIAE